MSEDPNDLSFAEAVDRRVRPLAGRVVASWEPVWAAIRERYEAAGAPYGTEDEGVFRWLREQVERDAAGDASSP